MTTNVSTPPPKSRGRHQHSKSATPTTFPHHEHTAGASGRGNTRRNKGNRHYDQNNAVNAANLSAYPADQLMGYAVELSQPLGTVDVRNVHSADDAAISDSMTSAKTKKGRSRQRRNNAEGTPNAASPSKTGENTRTSHDLAVQTPAKKQMAYAGPTFHASPAPSALPVPKFFSKSVPSATNPAGLQARLDEESDHSLSPPANDDAATAPEVVAEESPLDFFFRADREEKALKSGGLLTPTAKLDRVDSYDSVGSGARHSRHASNGSPRGMFALELDGNSIPANIHENGSTTQPERRAPNRSVTAPVVNQSQHGEHDDEVSQKLKNMLFSIPNPATTLPSPPSERGHIPSEPNSRFHTPSPFYRPNSVPNSAPPLISAAPIPSGNGPLHYGNRNLSPLFKAAKHDSIKRSSNLRQEVTDHHFNQGPLRQPNFTSAPHVGPPNQDISSISRNYLNLHIQSQPMVPELPLRKNPQHFPANAGPTSELPANHTTSFQYHASSVSSAPNISNGAQNSIVAPSMQSRNQAFVTSAQPVDVQSMENDLRRMLNLNVVGNGVR